VASDDLIPDQKPEALQRYAERRIKLAIAQGEIEPGTRLSPTALATEFGISHIPVREALTFLSASGYVEHRHRMGFFSLKLSSEDLADTYHWRELLEREAYILAVPKITDGDIKEMERLVKELGRRTKPKDRLDYIILNREFHFIPFKRAGSEKLLRFLIYLWDISEPYMNAELVESSSGHAEHVDVIALYKKRDTDAIVALMDAHRRKRLDSIAEWEVAHSHKDGAPTKKKSAKATRTPDEPVPVGA
jgi:DNA-binding GntR family transcriptional regulator